jgi:hypothetical protein
VAASSGIDSMQLFIFVRILLSLKIPFNVHLKHTMTTLVFVITDKCLILCRFMDIFLINLTGFNRRNLSSYLIV